jgi:hypothetical protein
MSCCRLGKLNSRELSALNELLENWRKIGIFDSDEKTKEPKAAETSYRRHRRRRRPKYPIAGTRRR